MDDLNEKFKRFDIALKGEIARRWPSFYFNGQSLDGCAYMLDVANAMLRTSDATSSFFFHFCMCMGGEREQSSLVCLPHFQALLSALEASTHQAIQTEFNKRMEHTTKQHRRNIRKRWIHVLRQMMTFARERDTCHWVAHYYGLTDQLWLREE